MNKISICLVINTGYKNLQKTLTSFLDQSYRPIQICLLDNASEDDSSKILGEFYNKVAKLEEDVSIVSTRLWTEDSIHSAIQKCMDLATGEYLCLVSGGVLPCQALESPSNLKNLFVDKTDKAKEFWRLNA
jgi:glycosyltransferase involved in cell wall biosynthesis